MAKSHILQLLLLPSCLTLRCYSGLDSNYEVNFEPPPRQSSPGVGVPDSVPGDPLPLHQGRPSVRHMDRPSLAKHRPVSQSGPIPWPGKLVSRPRQPGGPVPRPRSPVPRPRSPVRGCGRAAAHLLPGVQQSRGEGGGPLANLQQPVGGKREVSTFSIFTQPNATQCNSTTVAQDCNFSHAGPYPCPFTSLSFLPRVETTD